MNHIAVHPPFFATKVLLNKKRIRLSESESEDGDGDADAEEEVEVEVGAQVGSVDSLISSDVG